MAPLFRLCISPEVRGETDLEVISATPIAIYSGLPYAFTNAYGGQHQMLSIVFRVDEWSGSLLSETTETVEARFFDLDRLPAIPSLYQETLDDLRQFHGQVILK